MKTMRKMTVLLGITVAILSLLVMFSSCTSRSRSASISAKKISNTFHTIFIPKDDIVGVYDTPDGKSSIFLVRMHEDTVSLSDPSRIKILNDIDYEFVGILYYKQRGK